ncbi:flagellar protein FlaG [Kordiimonas aquimaris]|uniref:flagellar protein FlaG n=1 Tax=Kordiimonas aquimaris TaxID=707591 RepID=UPI0021D0F29B|nr:flagellar protein FlaG [Kordiimonas aquimaris]
MQRSESNNSGDAGTLTAPQTRQASFEPPEETNGTFLRLTEGDPLVRAAEALEELIPEIEQTPNTRLRIEKDEETGRFIYSNVDNESGEVVRQFPPESIFEFLASFRNVEGLLVDDEV